MPDRFPVTEPARDSISALLMRAAAHEPTLNRIDKDLRNGEYNLCLTELSAAADITGAIAVLGDSVDYFATLYRQRRSAFRRNLSDLEARLLDPRITCMIRRFVTFHEQLYTHRYDGGLGD